MNRFIVSIKELDGGYSLMWGNKSLQNEAVISILEAFLSKYKEHYQNVLMGNTKPF